MGNSYFISTGIQGEYESKKAQQAIMYEQAIVQQQSMHQLNSEYLERGYLPDESQNFGYKSKANGYQNHAYQSSSQDPLGNGTVAVHSKYSDMSAARPLRRSASSASQLIAGLNGLDVQNDMYHQQMPTTGMTRGHGKHINTFFSRVF